MALPILGTLASGALTAAGFAVADLGIRYFTERMSGGGSLSEETAAQIKALGKYRERRSEGRLLDKLKTEREEAERRQRLTETTMMDLPDIGPGAGSPTDWDAILGVPSGPADIAPPESLAGGEEGDVFERLQGQPAVAEKLVTSALADGYPATLFDQLGLI